MAGRNAKKHDYRAPKIADALNMIGGWRISSGRNMEVPYKTDKIATRDETTAYMAARTVINETTGCHNWIGPRTQDGYGQIGSEPIVNAYGIKGAHRLAYALANDHTYTSRHEQVMHACDNRRCVNPNHLELGTATQNMAQAWSRGGMRGRVGENNPRAKLTNDIVREVKRMIAYGWRNKYIAEKLEISRVTVSKIRTGRSWRTVTI